MKFKSQFHITGTGRALPEKCMTNKDMEQFFETSDEWISRRTGIKQRYFVKEKSEFSCSDLATEAAKKALDMAGVDPKELDLIILGTLSPDTYLPATAVLVQKNLGATKALSFDVAAACTGFVLSLDVAAQFISHGRAKKVLVIGGEVLSRYFTWTHRETDVIFADGAAAAVLEATHDKAGLIEAVAGTDSEFWKAIYIPGFDGPRPQTVNLDGKNVFKQAVKHLSESTLEVLMKADTPIQNVDHFFFHQANIRINEAVAEKLEIPAEKLYSNIHKYGNTSAASIPILLDETNREGKIKEGDLVLFAALGSGLTYEALLLRW